MKQKTITIKTSFKSISTWYIILSVLIFLFSKLVDSEVVSHLFSAATNQKGLEPFMWNDILHYFRFILHILGNSDWANMALNFCILICIANEVEDKYGKINILFMMVICAVTSGVLNACFSTILLFGSNGITCMFLLIYIGSSIDKKQFSISSIFFIAFYLGNLVNISIKQMSLNCFYGIAGALCAFLISSLSMTANNSKKG